ncbi:CRISPR-associated endoribonuclease Cas2 [Sporotomaculum syntrophicum]|uniref:CRISPR-associated endoribonuclease Cas2 n=1 Tax=Sporotomaculum syntrophicum TaxID=182264 RepID=A0A9D2WM48_9FIRM|nr:CRISPR-associated endonuclease Cas2 [Sporotomaculum syntrophicum]KAF1083925.1 CRISPR-associated endoribonuclease Cas2 [Sporotomaculum syntrophicum]
MGQNKLWHLVAYDIRDPNRLRRVAKHLKGYGERIQFSVFRCRLSNREVERLRWELSKYMTSEDDLIIIGLCSSCVSRLRKSTGDGWPDEPPSFEII